MNYNENNKGAHSMYKFQLARAYNPQLSNESAVQVLNRWIAKSPELTEQLRDAGYSKWQKILTPAQVQVIINHLGRP